MKGPVVYLGERCRSSGVVQKSGQCLLALQTIDALTGIGEIRAKAIRALINARCRRGDRRIETVVTDILGRSQTRQQNAREEKRMRVTRDGKSSPLADSGIAAIRRNHKTRSDCLKTAARLMELHSRQL